MSATTSAGLSTGAPEAGQQGWSWTIDPLDGWIAVPSARSDSPEVISGWRTELVEAVRSTIEPRLARVLSPEDGLSDEDSAELHGQVTAAVDNLLVAAEETTPGTRVVALVGLQDRGPVPVLVSVALGEPDAPDDTLLEVLGATGGDPVNPPSIEYLDLPDGDGVRVSRLDIDPSDGSAWVTLGVGRRTEHPDAVVDTAIVWRTQDLIILDSVGEAVDRLLPAVRITRSEA